MKAKSNLRLVLVVSLLFGMSTGLYEFVLPYFLKNHGINFTAMGYMFAFAGFAMLVARIYMGGLSDRWGRKKLYGWALGVCGGAMAATPHFPALIGQIVLQTLRETAALTRETIHPIVLYEARREGFLNLVSKFRGVETLFQSFGTTVVLLLIWRWGGTCTDVYSLGLYIAGGCAILGACWWGARFSETWRPGAQGVVRLRELVNLDMHPNLLIIAITSIIFNFGLMMSHSFYMVLFFKVRYGASDTTAVWIQLLHRISIALPLLVVGNLPLKNLRAWYALGLALQGITIAISALMPTTLLSAGFFLIHDFIGAGLWSPIQATLIQRYSRDATRGLEVGKVLAWGSIGGIFGPLAAGYLVNIGTALPFLASGLFVGLAAIPLLWLNLKMPAAAGVETATV